MATERSPASLDDTLLALADPTRRSIIERLAEGELRVTELARPFEMSLNGVSKHIRILERARLVQRRRVGRQHLMSFNPEPLSQAAQWMQAQSAFWNERLCALDALLQSERRSAPRWRREKGSKR